jgi:phosphoglycerate dehydrogenase-like enzyme
MIKLAFISEPHFPEERKQLVLQEVENFIKKNQLPWSIEWISPPFKTKYDGWIFLDANLDLLASCPLPGFIVSINAGYHALKMTFPSILVERAIYPMAISRMARYVTFFVLEQLMQKDRWAKQQKDRVWNRTLPHYNNENPVIGILGAGVFGTAIAKSLMALGFDVTAYQRTPTHPDNIHITTSLTSLLPKVNILINTLPDTPDTKNIINKKMFSLLEKNTTFINTGRGAQIDEEALLEALDKKILSKAILDVFKEEPLPPSHLLWRHPQAVITPHISGAFSLTDLIPKVLHQVLNLLDYNQKKDEQHDN